MTGPSDGATPLVSVRGLRIGFDTPHGTHTAVRGLDLDIHRGECVALVGESGSGKSLTARALTGLLPERAQLHADLMTLDGQDVRTATEATWRSLRGTAVGLVLQDALTSLDPLRRLGQEVGEVLTTHRVVPRRDVRGRAVALLGSVGIPQPEVRANQFPHELSGGLRQRGLIATSLAGDPGLLIADEPTTALDVTVQAQILDLLEQKKRSGTALLLISHDLAVVARIADRVVVLRDGEVQESGPTSEVLRTPASAYTRELLDAVPSHVTRGLRLSGSAAGTPLPTRSVDTASIVLAAEGLGKSFGHGSATFRAVTDVGFEIRDGETVGIVGESGSGKTTVARIALGLIEPDTGTVRLAGEQWSGVSERRRRRRRKDVQFIAQDPLSSFDPRYDVARIVAESLPPEISGHRARRARVEEVLDLVRLSPAVADRHPRSLSGGQRQRVSIARALAPRPRLLVADEPVSALDVSVQAQILDLLAELQAQLGTAVLFISHDLGVVHHIADRVLVMKDGRVVESGAADDVFFTPRHDYTRRLLDALPRVDAAPSLG